jgi:cephalosporin hydroxylase
MHAEAARSRKAQVDGVTGRVDTPLIRSLLAKHQSFDALSAIDDHLRQAPDDLEALMLRVECLIAIGRHETALELARRLRDASPAQDSADAVVKMLEEQLVNPTGFERMVTWRDWHSEVPKSFLSRMQRALHSYTYRGVQMVKDPFDLALYPLLLWRLRPRTIVEIGSKAGGSGLYFGDLLTNFDIDGHVHSYDVFRVEGVEHPRVTFHRGDGQRLEEVITREALASWARPLLVVEDADHAYETSIAVLRFFDSHLQPGDWIVTEDGNLSDLYPELYPDGTSGPHLALREFLAGSDGRYRIATEICDFFAYNATANSNGFLERIDER